MSISQPRILPPSMLMRDNSARRKREYGKEAMDPPPLLFQFETTINELKEMENLPQL